MCLSGINSNPLPLSKFQVLYSLALVWRTKSARSSCSSRGVTVTSGVIQWGCSICVAVTRAWYRERKDPFSSATPGDGQQITMQRQKAKKAGTGEAVWDRIERF